MKCSRSRPPDRVTEITRIDEGIYDLGAILPPGLDEQTLQEVVASATFIGQPGHGKGALDMSVNGHALAMTIVPEPGSLSLAVLSFASLVVAARRYRP